MKIGFFELMFVVFLVLKLTHVVAWSWWIITAPIWAPLLVAALLSLGVVLLIAAKK